MRRILIVGDDEIIEILISQLSFFLFSIFENPPLHKTIKVIQLEMEKYLKK